MKFMSSRRPSLTDVLQKHYDEAYQASVKAILLETKNEHSEALLQWKLTLRAISKALTDLESTPPRTTNEQSYMSSLLDIERQCHDRIGYLEYGKYNKSPYKGAFLPQIKKDPNESMLDLSFEGFDQTMPAGEAAAASSSAPRLGVNNNGPSSSEGNGGLKVGTTPVNLVKSETSLKPSALSKQDVLAKSRSTSAIDQTPVVTRPMVKTLRGVKGGKSKTSNGKAQAASKAATLAWKPSVSAASSMTSMTAATTGFEKLSLRAKQGGFTKMNSESTLDSRKPVATKAAPKRVGPTTTPIKTKTAVRPSKATAKEASLIDLDDVPPMPSKPPPPSPSKSPSGTSLTHRSTVYMANQLRKNSNSSNNLLNVTARQAPAAPPKPVALKTPTASPSGRVSPAKPVAVLSTPTPRKSVKKKSVEEDEATWKPTGDAEWDERCQNVLDNLRGIDVTAAMNILNEVVVKGDEVHWDDIAGLDIAKGSLKEAVVYPFLRPDLFSGLREPARGMLLFGPPGTGKTMLARAVATESKSTFFSISSSSIMAKYFGESEKLVKALFYLAKALAPSIIFVDEIDSLLSSRGGNEHELSRRIKTEFLVQWSDLQRAAAGKDTGEDLQRVLVLAATNLPWAIDEAARRRFVRRQYIPLPERDTRYYQIYKLMSHQKHGLADDDMVLLLELTEGFSGSDITALAKDAALGPIRELGEALLTTPREKVRPITIEDFKKSLTYIRPSVSKEGLQEFEQWAKLYGSSGA